MSFKNIALAILTSGLIACGGGSSGGESHDSNIKDNNPTTETPAKKTTAIAGIVTDNSGKPLEGVSVTADGKSVVSSTAGKFELEVSNKTASVLTLFKHKGYITTTKPVAVKKDQTSTVTFSLTPDQVSTAFDASAGVEVQPNGATVDIPAGAIVTEDGKDYTGTVNIAASYYNPDNALGTELFAAPYRGQNANGSDATDLITAGVVEVKLTDDAGNLLQLKAGKKAQITVPASSTTANQSEIPLWYYDEAKMVWIKEGKVTKQADGSFKGEVSHFTLWNVDIPVGTGTATVEGCFVDKDNKPVKDVFATLQGRGWANYGESGSDGRFTTIVPSGVPLRLTSTCGLKDFKPVDIPALSVGEVYEIPCKKVSTLSEVNYNLGIDDDFSLVPAPTEPSEGSTNPQPPANSGSLAVIESSVDFNGLELRAGPSSAQNFQFNILPTVSMYSFESLENTELGESSIDVWVDSEGKVTLIGVAAGSLEEYQCLSSCSENVEVLLDTENGGITFNFDNAMIGLGDPSSTVPLNGTLSAKLPENVKLINNADLLQSQIVVPGFADITLSNGLSLDCDSNDCNYSSSYIYQSYLGQAHYILGINTEDLSIGYSFGAYDSSKSYMSIVNGGYEYFCGFDSTNTNSQMVYDDSCGQVLVSDDMQSVTIVNNTTLINKLDGSEITISGTYGKK